MKLDEYQQKAREFRLPSANGVEYSTLGLCSEVGELAGKLKKSIRDGSGLNEMAAELGDCLWYIAAVADDLGVDLSGIADYNIEKLTSRKVRGKIKGSGDTR